MKGQAPVYGYPDWKGLNMAMTCEPMDPVKKNFFKINADIL